MAKALAERSCTICRRGIPPLTVDAAEVLHAQALDWALLDAARRLERADRLRNFGGWGFATVSLHTKKIKGLHENDFIMAAQFDRIAAAQMGLLS
jgi:4a-hydroxytetrahydrobiopterin dehydratase